MIKGFLIDYGGGYNEAVDTPEDLKRIYRDYLNDHYKNPYLTKRQVEQAENILADYEAIFYEAESIGPLWDYETFDNTFGFIDADEKAERLRHRDKLKALGENMKNQQTRYLEVIHILAEYLEKTTFEYEYHEDIINDIQSNIANRLEELVKEIGLIEGQDYEISDRYATGNVNEIAFLNKKDVLIPTIKETIIDELTRQYGRGPRRLTENINKDYEKTYDYLTKFVNLIREWGDHEIDTDALNELQSMVIDEIEGLEVFPLSLDEWLFDLLVYRTQIGRALRKLSAPQKRLTENTNYHEPYDERNLDYLQNELRYEVQRLEDLLKHGANGVYEGREYKGYERDDFTKAELDMLVIPYEVDFDADGYPIIRYRRA